MILTCNTIQDLLPLVVEDLASEDTEKLIKNHIENCPKCKREYKELKAAKLDYKAKNELESIPLKNINKKLKNKNIYTGLIAALIISLLLIIGLNIATKPIPLSYDMAIESTQVEGSRLFIEFKPEVSNYNIVCTNRDGIDYGIMAWKNNISNLFETREAKTAVINIDEEETVLVRFISQDSELDKLIYGKEQEGYSLTLPRLVMNYYLILMTILFIISGILSFIFRNMDKIYIVTKIIMIFAFSYILSHIVIFGLGGATHHIIRDLSFVIITTILTFSIFMLLLYKDNFIKRNQVRKNTN